MKRFLEVTDKDGYKVLLAVCQIKSVVELEDGTSCIELVENRKNVTDIVYITEKYIDISTTLCYMPNN